MSCPDLPSLSEAGKKHLWLSARLASTVPNYLPFVLNSTFLCQSVVWIVCFLHHSPLSFPKFSFSFILFWLFFWLFLSYCWRPFLDCLVFCDWLFGSLPTSTSLCSTSIPNPPCFWLVWLGPNGSLCTLDLLWWMKASESETTGKLWHWKQQTRSISKDHWIIIGNKKTNQGAHRQQFSVLAWMWPSEIQLCVVNYSRVIQWLISACFKMTLAQDVIWFEAVPPIKETTH